MERVVGLFHQGISCDWPSHWINRAMAATRSRCSNSDIDHQGICLGRLETFERVPPEGHVAGGRSGGVPGLQGGGHVDGRFPGLRGPTCLARELDLGTGKFVPPGGQLIHAHGDMPFGMVASPAAAAAFCNRLHVGGKNLADQVDEVVDAVVVNAVFGGGKQASIGRRNPACSRDLPGPRTRCRGSNRSSTSSSKAAAWSVAPPRSARSPW